MTETHDNRLVLHIGAHKTGTSAIQVHLQRNNALLMEQGWVFASQPEGPVNWSPMIGMHPAANGGQFHLRNEVYPAFLRRINSRRRHMIISSEDLFFLEADQIARMANDLAPIAPDITIIAYLRRQDLMAMSQWAQGGKTLQSASVFGCETSQLRPLTPQMRAYLDYDARMNQWQDAFPNAKVVIRIYDRNQLPGGDVVSDFLQVLGLPAPDVAWAKDINAALGSTTVQFIYWLRAQGFQQPEIRAILQRHVVEETSERALPSQSQVAAFLSEFEDCNRRLANRLGVEQVFDMDMSDYPVEASFRPLDPEFKLRNLMTLALSMRDNLKAN